MIALLAMLMQSVTRKKLPSIEVGPTALAQPITITLTYYPLRAMAMSYSHAKIHDQWPVGSEDMNGNKWTDKGDCITSLASAVSNIVILS